MMENQKVVNFLRSLADLIETKNEEVVKNTDNNSESMPQELRSLLTVGLNNAKKNHSKNNAEFVKHFMTEGSSKLPEHIKKAMMEAPKVNDGLMERSLDIIKRVEENDIVRAYKTKITNQDERLKRVFKELDDLRTQAIVDLGNEREEVGDNIEEITEK